MKQYVSPVSQGMSAPVLFQPLPAAQQSSMQLPQAVPVLVKGPDGQLQAAYQVQLPQSLPLTGVAAGVSAPESMDINGIGMLLPPAPLNVHTPYQALKAPQDALHLHAAQHIVGEIVAKLENRMVLASRLRFAASLAIPAEPAGIQQCFPIREAQLSRAPAEREPGGPAPPAAQSQAGRQVTRLTRV